LSQISLEIESAEQAASLRAWPLPHANVAPGWSAVLDGFFASAAGVALTAHLQAALARGEVIYPPHPLRALALTSPEAVRVVILGQDPYHGAGQANGLAFAVAPSVRTPPSLRNIYKELTRDLGRAPQMTTSGPGLLEHWARQGVLLLNTSLTVADGQAGSHARWGWAALTDALIALVARQPQPMVFMLWGAHAQAKAAVIETAQAGMAGTQGAPDRHAILYANHPSPLSALRPPAPFMGCGHFSAANAFLAARGVSGIDWLGDGER
jgi:uracil-DNA glycosylase